MNFKSVLILLSAVIFIFGCSAPKMLVSEKENAEKATTAGDFAKAQQAWNQYLTRTPVENVSGADFSSAAQSAFKNGDVSQSVSWFDQARYKNYASAEMYLTLAKIFGSQKNISKELSALEYVNENFKEKQATINNRLFDIYYEIKMPEKALIVWDKLDAGSKDELQKLEKYFLLKKELKDTVICDSVSLVILQKDAENVDALEWNAIKYYWQGENHYRQEMDIYNKNKTTRQYKILLKELDVATADMKKSLTYFEKLWEIEPAENYASYFANIYARFGDEKKAKYYQDYKK